jgi:hypothetical protein
MLKEKRAMNLKTRTNFVMPQVRIESFRKKNPIYALPFEWNNLAEHIRYQHNRTTFKIALFDYFQGILTDS